MSKHSEQWLRSLKHMLIMAQGELKWMRRELRFAKVKDLGNDYISNLEKRIIEKVQEVKERKEGVKSYSKPIKQ